MASSSSAQEKVVLQRAEMVKFTPEQVTFKACNFLPLVEIPEDKPQFNDGALFIKNCPLAYAFLHKPVAVTADLQAFWYTAYCTEVKSKNGNKITAIAFQIPAHGELAFTTGVLRKALQLPTKTREEQWDDEPTADQIADFLDSIGYIWESTPKVLGNTCEKKRVGPRWQYIFTQVIQCLCSKSGSQDQASKHIQAMIFALCTNLKLNFAEYIFSDMYKRVSSAKREKWVPYPRFIATIIQYLVGDAYTKTGNHGFSTIGKKSLEMKKLMSAMTSKKKKKKKMKMMMMMM